MRPVALLLAALLVTGCGAERTAAPETTGAWTRAADPPLSARYAPLLAWTGSEVLVLGGHTGLACPPNADCVDPQDEVRDGAAYDPVTDTWRPLAPAPLDVDRFTGHAVVGGTLVVGDPRRWWTYDVAGDSWTEVTGDPVWVPEATLDGLVYTHDRDRVQVYDVAAKTWTELPADPLRPRLRDGGLFATDAGVVLTGVDYDAPAPDEPTLTQADVWDGSAWRRLPTTGMIGPLVHWTGTRLVNPDPGGADGGEVNGWDRWYPNGGRLDPATGEWSALPGELRGYEAISPDGWTFDAASGPWITVGSMRYDDQRGTWTPLGRPSSPIQDNVASVWADDRLVTVGGTDRDQQPVLEAWVRTP